MVTFEEAIALLSAIQIKQSHPIVPLDQSLGKYLSTDIFAPFDVPNFDNSAMDGYAVCWQGEAPETFQLKGLVAAGDTWISELKHGEAIRIYTGAPIPPGCTSVIQQEWSEEKNGLVQFSQPISPNLNIRIRGSQTQENQKIVSAGMKISSGILGLLATFGIEKVSVFKEVTTSIVITGNELVEIGNPLPISKIYNSNGPMLQALFAEKGFPLLPYKRCLDNPEEIKETVLECMKHSDIVLFTGGISVGDFDFVRSVLTEIGVKEIFYKVKQKPGKPLYIGSKNKQVFIALPGNPGSVNSCFHAWVNPLIQQLNGGETVQEFYNKLPQLPLLSDYQKKSGLTHFIKASIDRAGIRILSGQESFNLSSLNVANALAILPEQESLIKSGSAVSYIPI